VAERADVSRQTLYNVESGGPAVSLGTYLRVLAVLGMEKDLALVAAEDPVGRRLQDAQLSIPRRAPKTKRSTDASEETKWVSFRHLPRQLPWPLGPDPDETTWTGGSQAKQRGSQSVAL